MGHLGTGGVIKVKKSAAKLISPGGRQGPVLSASESMFVQTFLF